MLNSIYHMTQKLPGIGSLSTNAKILPYIFETVLSELLHCKTKQKYGVY